MIEVLLVAIATISVLLFGSVEAWSLAIVGVMTCAAFVMFVLKSRYDVSEIRQTNALVFSAFALFLYPVFQLLPLPVPLLGFVHAGLREIIALSPDGISAFHSISIYPFATEMEVSRIFIYLSVFSIAAFGLRDDEQVFMAVKALIILGFVIGIFGIIQHATWNGKLYWFRIPRYGGIPFGPFVNRNHFAGFIGMIIPLSLGVGFMSRTVEKKIFYAFLGVVMAVSLFVSLSRGGIISFVAGFFVFSFISFTEGMSKRKLIPVFLFILVLAIYLLFIGVSPVMERFSHAEMSNDARLAAWRGTATAIADYPVFGSGLGSFQYIFKIYKPEGLYLFWEHAHNDYLEFLLEVGALGVIISAFFFFFALRIIAKSAWSGRERYLYAAFLSSITTMAAHSAFDFNFHIPSNAILFFLILGMAVSTSRRRYEE